MSTSSSRIHKAGEVLVPVESQARARAATRVITEEFASRPPLVDEKASTRGLVEEVLNKVQDLVAEQLVRFDANLPR